MKPIRWNLQKNILLKRERGVAFEAVALAIAQGNLLDVVSHPNQEKYPNQRMFILKIGSYAYVVHFLEDEQEIFLKTIIPSRKVTKKYLQGRNDKSR